MLGDLWLQPWHSVFGGDGRVCGHLDPLQHLEYPAPLQPESARSRFIGIVRFRRLAVLVRLAIAPVIQSRLSIAAEIQNRKAPGIAGSQGLFDWPPSWKKQSFVCDEILSLLLELG